MDSSFSSIKKSLADYIFCFVVGGIFLYAINRAIISATYIEIESRALFFIGAAAIFFVVCVLFNFWTRIFFAFVFVIFLSFVLREIILFDVAEKYPDVYELILVVAGQIPYKPHFARPICWLMSLSFSFTIVVFMLHYFNFYLLTFCGAAIFFVTWLPNFSRNETAFFIFLIAFCLILIRKINGNFSAGALAALPLCVFIVWAANYFLPDESQIYTRRYFSHSQNKIVNRFDDFFYEFFTPTYFSFQTTGFSGAGGKLGGAVTQNNRSVMNVQAPGKTYLAGATSNAYKGDRWAQTLRGDEINTHGLLPSRFEMLETSAALILNATHKDARSMIPVTRMGISTDEARRGLSRQFPVIG
ncbi:MAG: hypothetical protein FWD19_00205, partial [Defluviitaleaceae bacterium]|nr:hypothetical protein [Defluviitaleaceae bacterium]